MVELAFIWRNNDCALHGLPENQCEPGPFNSEYDFIIDSYYLFEDTQLAKRNFLHSSRTEEFGEAYLRVYGLLNACYLQQQAIFVCADVLGIKLPKQQIESCEIFDYRNCFAAHTPNRGYREAQHSYILDRSGLSEGKLRGYSSNSKVGHVSKDADIVELILAWDPNSNRAMLPAALRAPVSVCLFLFADYLPSHRLDIHLLFCNHSSHCFFSPNTFSAQAQPGNASSRALRSADMLFFVVR